MLTPSIRLGHSQVGKTMICDKCDRKNKKDANFCDRCGQSLLHIAGRNSGDIPTIPATNPPRIDESITQEQLSRILGGRYELKEMLGRGGMGVVYRAYDQQLGMDVAIKFLLNSFVNDIGAIASLKREARAAMRLAHPNILRLYNFEDTPEAKYLLMEYVLGESLSSIASRKPKGCFSEQEVKDYISDVCEALKCAHGEGIIHRDIKPSNILIAQDGQVKLADFGIAHFKETSGSQANLGGGTPIYMSPEQIAELPLDGRTDIYSLGITMYQMLSGAPPFTGDDVRHCHLHVTPKPIKGVSDWMNTVVLKCLRKESEGRWCNAEELRDVLKGKKEIGVAMSGVYQPEWLRARSQEKVVSPGKQFSEGSESEPEAPERRRLPVHKTPPIRASGVHERAERIRRHSGLISAAPESRTGRAVTGMLAGMGAGAIMIAIGRNSPWPIPQDVFFQLSWIMYGSLLGVAVGFAQRRTMKGLLSLALGLTGGAVAAILLRSLTGLAFLERFEPVYYGIPCAATVGAFLGISDGIYEKSLGYSIRCLLWGALGGGLAVGVFLAARFVFSVYWLPVFNWVVIGGALGLFLNMFLAFAKKPLERGRQTPIKSIA